MVSVAVELLPEASIALSVTVVVPIANVLPDVGVPVTVGCGSTRSVATAVYVTTAPVGPVASTLIGDGGSSVGALVSRTVTTKLPLDWFPEASRAVQSTSVDPTANVLPDAGRQITD